MNTRMTIIITILIAAIILPLFAGCSDSDSETPTASEPTPTESPTPSQSPPPTPGPTESPGDFQLAKSNLERDSSPNVSQSDIQELVAGNNTFAFDLYRQLQTKDGNLFFSPYSISAALAMTYAGAHGETESQMADTFHFNLPQETLHPAFNSLDMKLTEESENIKPDEGDEFTLNIANSIWGQIDYPFLVTFLDNLALNYSAGLRLVDFINAPEPARVTINDWVSDQTNQKIKDLIPQGAITDLTRLVLANAIYFKATWLHQFEESLTRDDNFSLLTGEQVTVPIMAMSKPEHLAYIDGEGYQAIELPYVGNKAVMTIIVPDSGSFNDFESGLTIEQLETIIDNLQYVSVKLELPKFSYEQSISMADMLAQMGMPDAFDPNLADFSGMDGTRQLYISDVFHKAFVAVDEVGTEAAAATAVVVGLSAMPVVDVELTIDRPFIYLIRDIEKGTILFVGRVLNPVQ